MPPPKPTVFCNGRRRICRKCGEIRGRGLTYDICPACGESMICGEPVVKGFSRCQEHGGPNPTKGIFGMPSDLNKFPIVQLAERYQKMVADNRLLSLRASIEVVRGRIAQLAERIDFNDAPDRLYKLDNLWRDYLDAKALDKGTEVVVLETAITNEFDKAKDDYAAWQQMLTALDLDRKLVDSEVKIIKEIKGILTAEDAHDLVAKMLSIILRVFKDEKRKLKQVQYEFIRLIGDRPDGMPTSIDDEEDDEPIELEAVDTNG